MTGLSASRSFPSTRVAALTLLLLVLAAFWPVVTGERSFFHLDLYYEHLPVWAATQKALLSGTSPFWLDGEYCGHPPLFHQEAPLFYPATVPLLLTGAPVHRLADLFTLFHFWLAGFAVFLLIRDCTDRAAAGLFGGIAWMLSARMIQSAIWPNAVAVSALVPLVLYGLSLVGRGQRRSGILCIAVSGGLALLAARPHVLLAAAPLVVSFAAAILWTSARRRQALADFGIAAVLAVALGAPSVLPTVVLLPETSRSRGLSADATDLQPLAQGHELDMVFLPVDGRARWPESAAYAGALAYALFLSGAYLFLARRAPLPRTQFLACALGGTAGLVLAFGRAGPYRFIADLPLIRGFRVPERFLFSWSLALALGSALALAHWLGRARQPRVLAAVCVLGLAGDLVLHARRAAPTAEAEVYAIEPAIVAPLRVRLGTDAAGFPRRFLALTRSTNPVPYPDADRLRLLRDAATMKGALGLAFGLESAYGAGPALTRIEEIVSDPGPRVIELAGVGSVILPARLSSALSSVFEPPVIEAVSGLPRAILVPETVVVPAAQAVRVALSPAFDPRRAVVLEVGEPIGRDPSWVDSQTSVKLVSREPSRVVIEAKLPAAGALVLFDSYETGWRASVDGEAAPVLRADAAFRAVRLPAGAHRVEFSYSPPGLKEGIGLGLAGLLGLALAAMRLKPGAKGSPAGAAPGF